MPALLGHNAFAYYAQNYAGIIRMSLYTVQFTVKTLVCLAHHLAFF